MEFIKEYDASDSEDDKPVTPHTSEQYKASENDRPPSPHKATEETSDKDEGHKATEETSDKEYGASNSKEDKPVTPHTSEQYKASENDRPPSPQSDGTEQAQGERHEVVDDMPEIVDDLTDEEIRHLCNEMGILIIRATDSLEGLFEFSKI